jgi:excisionase family DNA binding protein
MPRAAYCGERTKGGRPVELTTEQVAERLGITPRRVRALITAGRLKAKKIGRDYLIDSRDLAKFTPLPPGRPAGKG